LLSDCCHPEPLPRRSARCLPLLVLVGILLWPGSVLAAEVTLAWDASKSPESEVAGYRIHYGVTSGEYWWTIDAGKTLTYRVSGLLEGVTYYFSVSTYDNQNRRSAFSQEIQLVAGTSGIATASLYGGASPAGPSRWSVPASDPAGAGISIVFDASRQAYAVILGGPLMDASSFTVADVSGDGKADILWRNSATGPPAVWLMDGTGPPTVAHLGAAVDSAYEIVAAADFNGDGKADILWRHATTGAVWIWLMDGGTRQSEVYIDTVDPAFVISALGDFNGDGRADILWHHATLGEVWVWLMDGAIKLSETWVGTVPDVGYQIVKGK
jgi:hypothetical protein